MLFRSVLQNQQVFIDPVERPAPVEIADPANQSAEEITFKTGNGVGPGVDAAGLDRGPGADAPGDGEGLDAMGIGDGIGAGDGVGAGQGESNSSGSGEEAMSLTQALTAFAEGEGEGEGNSNSKKGQNAEGQGAGAGGEAALGEDQSPKTQRKRGLMLQPLVDQLASGADEVKTSSTLLKNLSEIGRAHV